MHISLYISPAINQYQHQPTSICDQVPTPHRCFAFFLFRRLFSKFAQVIYAGAPPGTESGPVGSWRRRPSKQSEWRGGRMLAEGIMSHHSNETFRYCVSQSVINTPPEPVSLLAWQLQQAQVGYGEGGGRGLSGCVEDGMKRYGKWFCRRRRDHQRAQRSGDRQQLHNEGPAASWIRLRCRNSDCHARSQNWFQPPSYRPVDGKSILPAHITSEISHHMAELSPARLEK